MTTIFSPLDLENHNRQRENTKKNELLLFLRGFKQCISDATKFFQDIEELDVSEGRCYRLIQNLKKQMSGYESEERDLSNLGVEQRVVWDTEESSDCSRISTGMDRLLICRDRSSLICKEGRP